ncbi:MAG: UDP-N-acetylmuramoyl-L-alanyl-D-glutamate--2,6-diaminopimelate ligase [Candidatus Kerfeldbacteria bacterium]|nr:UDP-N-acetylmuramoyl-L-alanyl-D-glutamate--2,6-diaminopimelate ligase [Candidatus Kerfeldbacteria bacterium]
MLKSSIRALLPPSLLRAYHRTLAALAAWWYGYPSRRLTVIGVTGTNGKSTVVSLIARVLEATGHRGGATSTVLFQIGSRTWLNDRKMTMLGRFALQAFLRRMVRAGCTHAVIETSSEGIVQSRHRGIDYDVAVFTNLTPEHIESHGSYDAYRDAKLELFRHVRRSRKRNPVAVVNLDDAEAGRFLAAGPSRRVGFSTGHPTAPLQGIETFFAREIRLTPSGSTFTVEGVPFRLQLLGRFNVENALAAIAVCAAEGIDLERIAAALADVAGVPGRLEFIDTGQQYRVIVDYAPEPVSLTKSYEVLAALPHRRIIHVLGSTGGGRDRARRPVLGRIAAEHADTVIVTNEDPYDDDPQEIIDQVAAGAAGAGKVSGETLHTFADRRDAIRFALRQAGEGDIVFITGKGSEQAMAVARGKKVPWDDRKVVRELLNEEFKMQKEKFETRNSKSEGNPKYDI